MEGVEGLSGGFKEKDLNFEYLFSRELVHKIIFISSKG